MDYHAFLIKYAEIAIKGKNRNLFEDALARNIRHALARVEGKFSIERESGRFYVTTDGAYDYDGAVAALTKVFGVAYICPVIILEETDYAAIEAEAVRFMRELTDGREGQTFKVVARRADKRYPMQSMEIARELGAAILDDQPQLAVDVHAPEIMLHVEVRAHCFLYAENIKGPGGMPVGTGGKAMLLLSGGIDSPVAGYMIAKRGVTIDAVYFHAPPYTSERAKQKVIDLAEQVSKYSGPMRLHVVNFTDIQMAIYQTCPHDELTIIMRRYMMRIAEHFANETGALGLITGESIGQVASQTMQSLLCTNAVCHLPVFRPLVGMDKMEIVEIAEKIETYETSILPYEDCCTIFVAKHPVTKPVLKRIERSEQKLADQIDALLEAAIGTTEVIEIGAGAR